MIGTDLNDMSRRRVLDAGSGLLHVHRRIPVFDQAEWERVTIDVDASVGADHIGSLTDMRSFFSDQSFDAIWSSHTLEHLFFFELKLALAEFRRILKPGGFVLVTCPDIEAVAGAVVTHGLDHTAYISPAGPITLHDILFGHGPSIERGATAMAHRTGLTVDRLGKLSLDAGFAETIVGSGRSFDLWAVLCGPETDPIALQTMLASTDFAFLFEANVRT